MVSYASFLETSIPHASRHHPLKTMTVLQQYCLHPVICESQNLLAQWLECLFLRNLWNLFAPFIQRPPKWLRYSTVYQPLMTWLVMMRLQYSMITILQYLNRGNTVERNYSSLLGCIIGRVRFLGCIVMYASDYHPEGWDRSWSFLILLYSIVFIDYFLGFYTVYTV